jgi:C4-dicarboxylate-specific signal transduction histidine kinase
MHAATVELLVQKAHLDPDTAIAIATAIDMALQNAQLVTVAVLDARFAASEAKMDARFSAFEAKVDARFSAFEAKVDARFAAVDSRFGALEAKMDARFLASEAKMEAALQKTKAELVRWVFLALLGNVALSVAANSLLNTLHQLP